MSLSVRGVARRFLNRTGTLSVRDVFFGGSNDSQRLRPRLESLARREFRFEKEECTFGWTARYEQTWSHVHVRIRLDPDDGIPDATMATLRTTWETAIENTWSNRWSIGRAGEVACPLTFDVEFIDGGDEHQTVRVRAVAGPTNMTMWDIFDGGPAARHEFGHMIGNPDEYADSNCPNRDPVNTGTVMDTNSNDVPKRLVRQHAENVGSNVV